LWYVMDRKFTYAEHHATSQLAFRPQSGKTYPCTMSQLAFEVLERAESSVQQGVWRERCVPGFVDYDNGCLHVCGRIPINAPPNAYCETNSGIRQRFLHGMKMLAGILTQREAC